MSNSRNRQRDIPPPIYLGRLFEVTPDRPRPADPEDRSPSPALSLEAVFEPMSRSEHDRPHHDLTDSPAVKRQGCSLCPGNHQLNHCNVFRQQKVERRLRSVLLARVCERCFSPDHQSRDCRSLRKCSRCRENHNTMLHPTERVQRHHRESREAGANHARRRRAPITTMTSASARQRAEPPAASLMLNGIVNLLLPTAVVQAVVASRSTRLRALIDPCSPVSRITRAALHHLRCPTTVVGAVTVSTLSLTSNHDKRVILSVVVHETPEFMLITPSQDLPNTVVERLSNMKLADPAFHQRAGLDLVLGADV